MIRIDDVVNIHNILIDRFGGATGVRDKGLLESAINRPYASFGGEDLYPTPIDKASAIFESILINHPFIDGNKRTAYVMMMLILMEGNLAIEATEDEKYDLVIAASKGEFRFEEIRNWLNSRVRPKS